MIVSEKDFIQAHIKQGAVSKLKSLAQKTSEVKDETPTNAFLSHTGGEIHVNGPTVEYLHKGETLVEKIARFDKLAERVMQNRRLMSGLVQDLLDNEENPDDFDFVDGDDVDEFGDVIEKAAAKGDAPLPAEPEPVQPAPVAEPTGDPEGDPE